MPRAKKPATKRKRETISGRYGTGEKAADALALRLLQMIDRGYAAGRSFQNMRKIVKAELLAATTVTESAPKRIGKVAYAIRRPRNVGGWLGGDDGNGWPEISFSTKADAEEWREANDYNLECKVKRVKLVEF